MQSPQSPGNFLPHPELGTPSASTSSTSLTSDKPKRKRPKFIRKVSCQVCGDVANDHVHYGAIVCYSCRAFFRRGVTNQTPFYCAQDQNCVITKATRKHCQYCRFQKCLGIGMKHDWVMTEDDKREKKEVSEQRKILSEIVTDKTMLKGATTHYEKRMRLERQLKRAERRRTKTFLKSGEGNFNNASPPPLIPVSPPPLGADALTRESTSSSIFDSSYPEAPESIYSETKSPTQPLQSESDTEMNDVEPSPTTSGSGVAAPTSMVSASTAAVLFDYTQPMTVDSGYMSVGSVEPSPGGGRRDSDCSSGDEEFAATSSNAQELLPSTTVANENYAKQYLPWKKSRWIHNEDDEKSTNQGGIHNEPIMTFTTEERGFIRSLVQNELDTSRAIPVPVDVMAKIITAAKVGSVVPVEVAVKGYTICMERVIKYASTVELFNQLSVRDQFNLLLKNVDMIVNIRTARILKPGVNLRDQLSHAIGWNNRSFDQMALSYSSSNNQSSSSIFGKLTNGGAGGNKSDSVTSSSGGRRLELFQMFPSPWASTCEYEQKYNSLLKSIFDLNMDHMTTSLLSMMALFNTSISGLENPQEVKNVRDNFTKLLYRYLCSEIGKTNAMKLLPQYSQTLRNLEEMADILATKRLKI